MIRVLPEPLSWQRRSGGLSGANRPTKCVGTYFYFQYFHCSTNDTERVAATVLLLLPSSEFADDVRVVFFTSTV